MGRLYTVSIDQVAVSAAQDLFGILATANMSLKIWRVELGQRTLTAWEAKPVKLIRNPSTATAGSGGSAPTPRPVNASDAAATFTCRINDTTAQTTNGTATVEYARDWEFLNGFIWVPLPDERPILKPSQGFGFNLPVAPSASMTVSGSMWVEELF